MDASPESLRGLLLRHRGRTRLTQRDLAERAGVSMRSVQDWEAGTKFPTAERLQALIRALLEAGGLAAGREMSEARELWVAAERGTPRLRASFDTEWFAGLLAGASPNSAGDAAQTAHAAEPGSRAVERAQDWGEAPDTMGFVGRIEELAQLHSWVIDERCRLVAVLGFGGIGKSTLAARLALQLAPGFERVYWRSLRNAPAVGEWLAGAIGFLSDQQLAPPTFESQAITALVQLLRTRRCLLILDNAETLFEPGQREGRYRAGLEGYGHVVQAVAEASHQSCLVLTSREAPPEFAVLGRSARWLELQGLGTAEAQLLLAHKQLSGDTQAWRTLVERYGGNGLALKIVAETIRQVYDHDVAAFLTDAVATSGTVFGGIRRLLDVQAQRLSPVEHDFLTRLAVEREPISLAELSGDMAPSVSRSTAVEAVETLRRRSLLERGDPPATFTLQSLVLEYVTDRLVETVANEIDGGQPAVLVVQPLIKAQAKDYVRQTQERLIGAPILQQLKARRGERATEERLLALLDGWRGRPATAQGYGPGNVVNLLRLQRGQLRGIDLSRLALRQVYLQGVDAQDASLAFAHLERAVLDDVFAYPTAVALSADSGLLAAGTPTGELRLWQMADRTPLPVVKGHSGGVWGVAFSHDGRLMASGSLDGTVRLWDAPSGQLVRTVGGHSGGVRAVALSSDGKLVASASLDESVRVSRTDNGRLIAALRGHAGAVWGVALSGDGALVASGGVDGTVRLWDVESSQPVATLLGHTDAVRAIALSDDGRQVASGGDDRGVRLWDARSGRLLANLRGHTAVVRAVAISAPNKLMASASFDGTVRLWSTDSGRLLGA